MGFKMKTIDVVSLFSGCGGTDLGITGDFSFLNIYYKKLPTNIVFANDIDPYACDIFDANFKIKSDRRDIKNINVAEIPKHDLLLAGFPCQSFSILAQNPPRLGYKDEKGKLFFEIVRVLKYHKPKYFICENVKGILSANKGKTFQLILDEFRSVGYEINYKILNSKYFGVPQKRERVFIVGIRNDLNIKFEFPEKPNYLNSDIPLRSVIMSKVPKKYYFSEKAIQGMIRSNRESKAQMNKGRAQDLDSPCNTVTAHLSKVSLNGTDPVLKIGEKYRRFTPREVARIQSFPDTFNLIGSDSSQYKALGNAIPPVMFWHIGLEITKINNNIKEKKVVSTKPKLEKLELYSIT